MRRGDNDPADAPGPGVITMDRQDNGWYLIQIGRARTVKKTFITDAEARQLATLITLTLEPS